MNSVLPDHIREGEIYFVTAPYCLMRFTSTVRRNSTANNSPDDWMIRTITRATALKETHQIDCVRDAAILIVTIHYPDSSQLHGRSSISASGIFQGEFIWLSESDCKMLQKLPNPDPGAGLLP